MILSLLNWNIEEADKQRNTSLILILIKLAIYLKKILNYDINEREKIQIFTQYLLIYLK